MAIFVYITPLVGLTPHMSAADNLKDSDEKVPEDIASTFDSLSDETDEPSTLHLDKYNSTTLRRETDGTPVAHAYDCETYGCRAYYAVRDEQKHFYQKGKGYPIDDVILQQLKESEVEKVFIGLKREKAVLEFDLEQYLAQDTFDHGFGVQRCAPKDEACHVWPNAVGTLFDDE